MTKLELFLVLFTVENIIEALIPETNKLLKNPMEHGEFIKWLGCWFYMGCWVRISNRNNWCPSERYDGERVVWEVVDYNVV